MNIAIHAAELDAGRVDGTRVYISELLKRFGSIGSGHNFHLYHRTDFNPELAPAEFSNYHIRMLPGSFHWTQMRFVPALRKLKPERLWMPIQVLPFGLPKGMQTIVTIHDLAFRHYPETFPAKDRRRHDWYTDRAVSRADRIIAITEATKRDLLKQYPKLSEEKIKVIHHGFDATRFVPGVQDSDDEILRRFGLYSGSYILYVGALQPRKNVGVLLDAFGVLRNRSPEMKLALVGAKAWMWKDIERKVEAHPFRGDIVMTGPVSSEDLPVLYRSAKVFVYPSLYEGFGIPVLEAQAAGVPVICADNSSLPEVGGDAALYFEATHSEALAGHIEKLWTDEAFRQACIEKGFKNTQRFSWDKCARETYEWIIRE